MAILSTYDRETSIRIVKAAGLDPAGVLDGSLEVYPSGKNISIYARVWRVITQEEFGRALIGDTE